jgi:hypothetical protein
MLPIREQHKSIQLQDKLYSHEKNISERTYNTNNKEGTLSLIHMAMIQELSLLSYIFFKNYAF